jgi:hypothetical protein
MLRYARGQGRHASRPRLPTRANRPWSVRRLRTARTRSWAQVRLGQDHGHVQGRRPGPTLRAMQASLFDDSPSPLADRHQTEDEAYQ